MAEQNSIRCIQLPIVGWQLIVPNVAVAEIIAYTRPEKEGDGWYDGTLIWRGAMVPIISVEKMCQREFTEPGSRSRIAIIYNLSGDEDLPYIGVILQDIPRAYLAEEDQMQSVVSKSECEFIYGRADIMLEQLMVPDLDAIMAAVKQKINQ